MNMVIGLAFLMAANGSVDETHVMGFQSMEECLVARETLKQIVAADPSYIDMSVEMACVAPEAFK